jgi:hypothetical protein
MAKELKEKFAAHTWIDVRNAPCRDYECVGDVLLLVKSYDCDNDEFVYSIHRNRGIPEERVLDSGRIIAFMVLDANKALESAGIKI